MCSRPSVSGHAVCGHRALASISQTWIPIPSPLDQYQCCARGAEGAAMEQRSCGRRWAVARSIPHGGPSSDATDRAALVGDGLSHSTARSMDGSTGCRLGQQACGSTIVSAQAAGTPQCPSLISSWRWSSCVSPVSAPSSNALVVETSPAFVREPFVSNALPSRYY